MKANPTIALWGWHNVKEGARKVMSRPMRDRDNATAREIIDDMVLQNVYADREKELSEKEDDDADTEGEG